MRALGRVYAWQQTVRQWCSGRAWAIWGKKGLPLGSTVAPRHALIVLTGLIGDTVMSTPVLVEARRLWPEARITVLGNRSTVSLLEACPLIDSCIVTPAFPFTIRNRRGVATLKQWLRGEMFDLALILLGDQYAAVLAEADIPVRVGVRGHLLEPCLTQTYDVGSPRTWGPPERLNVLRVLGYEVPEVAPCLWVSPQARVSARQRLVALGLGSDTKYAVVHPFGSTPRQWWPLNSLAEFSEALERQTGFPVVVVGGQETRGELSQALVNRVVDACGALSIQELLATLEAAEIVISTDSGPFHMAGALGRPLVGLFRARRLEHAARYRQAHVVFGQDLDCQRQCAWDHCRFRPCRQMAEIGSEEVLIAALDALKRLDLTASSERAHERG